MMFFYWVIYYMAWKVWWPVYKFCVHTGLLTELSMRVVHASVTVTVLCSCARHFTLILRLSTQGYKRGTRKLNAGVKPCNGLASHPPGVEILVVALCYRNQSYKHWLYPWALSLNADFTFLHYLLLVDRVLKFCCCLCASCLL